MPQEAWVLKCYSCKKFQVQLKKKVKKWQCRVCGAKQDLMTIFFKGSTSDCRINVQNMNAAEGERFDKLENASSHFNQNDSDNESEYELHNLQTNYYSHGEEDVLNRETVIAINEEYLDNESVLNQEIANIKEYSKETFENLQVKNFTKELEGFNYEINIKNENKNIDSNSENLSVEKFNDNISNNKIENHDAKITKLNIFESNCELDESLDF